MWSLIVTIVIGFIAGLIARAIHPGEDKAGFILTTLLGRVINYLEENHLVPIILL